MTCVIHYHIQNKPGFTCLVRTYPAVTVPMARKRKPDIRLTILLSFAAGLLIGVPLTFGAVILSTSQPGVHNGIMHPRISQTDTPRGNLSVSSVQKMLSESSTGVVSKTATDSLSSNGLADGIFWTEAAESLVPEGFSDRDTSEWHRFLNDTDVLALEEGCGRMQNRRVVFSNGEMSCCRYRHNNDQIQGEIFSFYLGRLLQIDNLVPSALILVDPRHRPWSTAASQMSLAQWNPERPAVLTRFVPNLQPAYIPKHLRGAKNRRLHNVDLVGLSPEDASEWVQWSDLIIFDYLTANLDRVVNNMFNERWNGGMMSQPIHNLAKTPEGLLLFLDNESGLVHGYRLLDKYEPFHRSLLDALCVFRRRTVRAVERLHREDNVDVLLRRDFDRGDPGMTNSLPFLPENSIRILKRRLSQVLRQVDRCRRISKSQRWPSSAMHESDNAL